MKTFKALMGLMGWIFLFSWIFPYVSEPSKFLANYTPVVLAVICWLIASFVSLIQASLEKKVG